MLVVFGALPVAGRWGISLVDAVPSVSRAWRVLVRDHAEGYIDSGTG